MTRAATTLAGPCTGAPRRDFLLGLRHGQLVSAHAPSWSSGHGADAGCSHRAVPPGQLTATRPLRKVLGCHEPPRRWPVPVRALQGATSYWACVMANSSAHMPHHGPQGTVRTLVAPIELSRLASLQRPGPSGRYWDVTSRHDAGRSLYGRSKARLPTGPASWPTRQGTCPIMVLRARCGRWLLPTSWPAWPAYNSSRPDACRGYRCGRPRWHL